MSPADRVVLAGADGLAARRLRDRGVEVVWTDDADPAAIASTCVQEDADAVVVVGVDPAAVRAALADRSAADVVVVVEADELLER